MGTQSGYAGYSAESMLASSLAFPPLALLVARRRPRPHQAVLLGAVATAYIAPFFWLGLRWDWKPWAPLLAVLVVLPSRVSWPLTGLGCAVTLGIDLGSGADAQATVSNVASLMTLVIAAFGPYALGSVVQALHATRAQSIHLSVLTERRRLDAELQMMAADGARQLYDQLVEAARADTEHRPEELDTATDTARRLLARIRAAAGGFRHEPQSPLATAPVGTSSMARQLQILFFLNQSFFILILTYFQYHRPWTMMFTVPWHAVLCVLLFAGQPSRRRLLVATVLLLEPAVAFGPSLREIGTGIMLIPALAGFMFTKFGRLHGWLFTAVTGSMFVMLCTWASIVDGRPVDAVYVLGWAADFLAMVWSVRSLVCLEILVGVLRRAQADLSREAVRAERTRMARDLHDTLSFTLSAIALKGELCARMIAGGVPGAQEHLLELPILAGRLEDELRTVIDRNSRLCLAEELVSVRSVLATAGIQVMAQIDDFRPAPELDHALAAVLREAATNVVKHSHARTCTIVVAALPGLIRLRVVNDGVPPISAAAPRTGTGLLGMVERTDGRVSARPLPPGRFEIMAEFVTDQPAVADAAGHRAAVA
ncbi:sensor histidine kinase [Catenulispora subtropica]|uniref:sensor histidine kinase n=1 Tax=Catenulispora subtropica TaxID=450798 RepID=UPI0031E20BC9